MRNKEEIQKLRILSLASGSKGNCYYVEAGGTGLLVDCGLSLKSLQERLQSANIDISKIKYVLVSHEHSDHTKGLSSLSKKYSPQIFCNYVSTEKIVSLFPDLDGKIMTFDNEKLFLGEMEVTPIPVSHDSSFCTAFKISAGQATAAIVTDIGVIGGF